MAKMLERLVFIDETSLKTNLVKTTGWAPVGARLIDHAPFGHWQTQTFIAGLAHDGLVAPSPLSLGPCMDGSCMARGLFGFGIWSVAAMYTASKMRLGGRAP